MLNGHEKKAIRHPAGRKVRYDLATASFKRFRFSAHRWCRTLISQRLEKRGTISKDSAAKIAEATNVSLSRLLTGKEDTNREALDDDEKALLDVYRNLPPVERRNMLAAFQMRLQKLTEFYSEYVDPITRQK